MRKKKRGLSAGSVVMLAFTSVVLLLSVFLLMRLNSGKQVDVTRLTIQALTQGSGPDQSSAPENEAQPQASVAKDPAPTYPAAAAPAPEQTTAIPARFTLTAAGTLALEKNIRQSCYSSDTKHYDFTELLSLLKPELYGDYNTVFLENLLMDEVKVSDLIVPSCAADLLKDADFDLCLSGFPKAWDKKNEGVEQTIDALKGRGITVLGLAGSQEEERFVIRESEGIRVAIFQYAADVASTVRKKMAKAGAEWAIPEADPDQIAADIARARAAGAEAFVVFLHWGKTAGKTPDKTQTNLAQQIADGGADLIIGAGSRVTQKAEYLTSADGRQTLCAYCLGTLMSDERGSVSRIGSCLLHAVFTRDGTGKVRLSEAAYTPTYVWRYRQDSTYYYKCLAADLPAPDGMDNEQVHQMELTCSAIRKALEGSPVGLR